MTTTELDRGALRRWPLPRVDASGDKEARGSVLIVAGSAEVPGAALLAAKAALRAGAGKLCIATAAEVALPLAVAVPEARVIALQTGSRDSGLSAGCEAALCKVLEGIDALLVGPGLADEPGSIRLARWFATRCAGLPRTPRFILDAAALGAVADHDDRLPVLLTPHAGEMASLAGIDKHEVIADAQRVAREAAQRWNAVVALKGAQTFICAPDGRGWRHECSIPGLAMSGSGDVLAGAIAGFAARGAGLEQAAAWGVVMHARAGLELSRRIGAVGFLARELADALAAELAAEPAAQSADG